MTNYTTVVVGDRWDLPFQCVIRGSRANAVFGPGDVLRAFVYQGKSATPLFLPSVTFYTASGTQTGYEEGQVLVSSTNAQGAMLVANGSYAIQVQWAPALLPTNWSSVVRNKLIVEPVGVYV